MEFIKTKDSKLAVKAVVARLKKELASGKKVLWLMCGGSAISAEIKILKTVQKSDDTESLAIILMDERYGKYGHVDSNWQQLIDSGADFGGMYAVPVMSEVDRNFEDTVAEYSKQIKVMLDNADVVIGVFGIGADGHTAGILPGTPAVTSSKLVVGYNSPPYKRITLTKTALKNVDVAYALTFGKGKNQALQDLQNHKKSFEDLPSNIFWDLSETYVYNDQIGEKI